MENKDLQPREVFDCFAMVNRVPRPSKHEEKMAEFLLNFGKELGLKTKIDETGNVSIFKPATPGYENRATVVLQSHMDMVCEKNADVDFDFKKDAIQTYVDGEWLKAKGTTLGADDGIGVAMEMALLQSSDIEHGPIQCIFTRDEETGLSGAFGMKSDFMEGDYLINLDSEDEGQIFVSCAGGANTIAAFPFTKEALPAGFDTFRVVVKGLMGGHSGDDINKKRANANKLLLRFLCDEMEKTDLRLVDIQAGGLHNAIPREAEALCAVPSSFSKQLQEDLAVFQDEIKNEFSETEKSIMATLISEAPAEMAQAPAETRKMLLSLRAVHNGVLAMSQTIDNFVETSSNLASIRLMTPEQIASNPELAFFAASQKEPAVVVITSQRSSIESNRRNISAMVRAAFELGGAQNIKTGDGYPGWTTNPSSILVKMAVETYKELFNKEPQVLGIHAGLECGLFSVKYPHMDMISFGPTLRGVHSPDERLLIPTVPMVWDHLCLLLKRIPEAGK